MRSAWEALERNDFRSAEAAAREALAASPAHGEALYLLGSTLLFEGRFREALGPLTAAFGALAQRGVAYRLGHCHLALGDLARAEQALRHETQYYPESANAHNTLGVVLVRLSRNEEALAEFTTALRLEEAHGEANNNAGNVLRALGRHAQALPYLERAVATRPDSAEVLRNLCLTLHDLRRYDEAAAGFRRVLRLEPHMPYALGALVWSELYACDWRDLGEHVAALRAGVAAGTAVALPFTMLAVSDSPAEQRRCAELHLREVLGEGDRPLWRAARPARTRLRLAYLSADFHEHATAYLTVRLFELHDRSRFEVIAASYGPHDGSPMRARLERTFDRFVDVRGMDDAQAAQLLLDMEVDIAIDLKGHTGNARPGILARRPAPLQVSYLGYPGTMGGACIDYLLADRWLIPDADQRFYTEQVVRLPDCYQAPDPAVPVATLAPTRGSAGLPADAFVFCCFNDTYKLTPEMFALWMRLLAAVPRSVLWLLEPTPAAVANLRREARERGIDPERLVFAPRIAHAEHLARHRLADLFLDTLPCNAHTTASDALCTGLPVLTCLGSTFAGRVAASLLDAAGLPELIARSTAEYEALALSLAHKPAALAELRTRLAQHLQTQPLFDSARTCRQIEAAYRRMWEAHERGEPPRGFSL